MAEKPKLDTLGNKELDKAVKQVDEFNQSVKDLTLDRMNEAPKLELEPQTKLSSREIANSKDIYLKPKVTMSCKDVFNEKYRDAYNYAKEYVCFIAENNELVGEELDIWTKKFAGIPAEEWIVPTNKPVWGPRYLAEQIKSCSYHRLKMNEGVSTGTSQMGSMYGQLVVDNTVQRLDARPAGTKRSVFV